MSGELTKCDEEGVPLLVQEIWIRNFNAWFCARLFNGAVVNCHLPENLLRYVITMPKESQFQFITDFVMVNYKGLMKNNIYYGVFK
jgi:hypothetical protein